jgi:methylated-DNA-[protein]-cysteine S-methyltransferase
MIVATTMDSPVGPLLLRSDGLALTGLFMTDHRGMADHHGGPTAQADWRHDDQAAPFPETKRQLAAYFAGERRTFDLPLKMAGTPFQRQVWAELGRIPFGETLSYGELAKRLGNPNGSRAVGLANGRNPIAIIVPCHRVIGSTGKLVGYGGGLARKQALLAFEASVWSTAPQQLSLLADSD